MVTSFSKQVEEQRKYHKRVQASLGMTEEAIAAKLIQKKKHDKGFIQDSAKETGVHPDQQELVMKLKAVKKSMQKVKLLY